MEGVSVIIFQDYNKGVLTSTVIKKIIAAAKDKHIPIAVDPKKDNFWAYQEVDLFKPNLKELNDACGTQIAGDNITGIEKETKKLQKKIKAKNILLTLSENGIFHLSNESFHQTAFERNIVDVSGAGDSVIAAAALGLSLEITTKELCTISNLAGGLVCEKAGVVPVQKENLLSTYSLSCSPQNLQCVASTSCPSLEQERQACVLTLLDECLAISAETIPVGTAIIP